jgi:hypothetical protein
MDFTTLGYFGGTERAQQGVTFLLQGMQQADITGSINDTKALCCQ